MPLPRITARPPAGCGHGLAGNARLGVLGQEQVDDSVADLVGDLVGMAFGNRFGGKEIAAAHVGVFLIKGKLYMGSAL
jgi:hypothetical protein